MLRQHTEETVQADRTVKSIFKLKKQAMLRKHDFKRAERAELIRELEQGENETRTQRTQLKQVEEQLHQTEVARTDSMSSLKIC